jgi:hypothetical protein
MAEGVVLVGIVCRHRDPIGLALVEIRAVAHVVDRLQHLPIEI